MKKLSKKILIFDLDGVIIDSKKNMQISWTEVQKKFFLNHINFETYFKNIGKPFYEILKSLGLKNNFSSIAKVYQNTSLKNQKEITYYKNTIEVLKELKKKKFVLSILTSKDLKRTKNFLKNNLSLFKYIQCDDKRSKGKPHPDKIYKIIKLLNVKKEDCVYIGDTNVDYLTAKNSGIDFVFASWGYGKNLNYKHKCRSIRDLKKLLK